VSISADIVSVVKPDLGLVFGVGSWCGCQRRRARRLWRCIQQCFHIIVHLSVLVDDLGVEISFVRAWINARGGVFMFLQVGQHRLKGRQRLLVQGKPFSGGFLRLQICDCIFKVLYSTELIWSIFCWWRRPWWRVWCWCWCGCDRRSHLDHSSSNSVVVLRGRLQHDGAKCSDSINFAVVRIRDLYVVTYCEVCSTGNFNRRSSRNHWRRQRC